MSYTTNSVNEVYWRKYTEEASQYYLAKMLELGTKEELKGSFHGIEAPNHLMYKIDTLYSKDGHRAYDFLLEYNIHKPSVGIYYGCKGLTLNGHNHDDEIERFNTEWDQIKGTVCTILNNTFPGKNFGRRIKCTDNANNNTYWPFWITLYEEEDIKEVGIRALTIIRNVYKHYLDGEQFEKKELPSVKNNPDLTAFTLKAYGRLKKYFYDNDCKSKKLNEERTASLCQFEAFMKNATNEHIFYHYEESDYEFAWQTQEFSNSDFIKLFTAFFQLMVDKGLMKKTKGDKNEASVPWEKLRAVILSHNGQPYPESLRTQLTYLLPKLDEKEKEYWKDKANNLIMGNSEEKEQEKKAAD